MIRETIVEPMNPRRQKRAVRWALARGHVPQCTMRRVMIFVPDELYARMLTAAWARKRRMPSKPYSVSGLIRDVMDAVLPPAVPGTDRK